MLNSKLCSLLFLLILLLGGIIRESHAATFGKTSIGGTEGSEASIQGIKFTAPSGGGDITKLSLYTYNSVNGSHTVGVAIYADSSGVPGALLATDSGNVTVSGNTPTWYDVNISYTFSSSQVLWLCFWSSSGEHQYFYDTGGTDQFAFAWTGTFETWPNPGNAGGFLARETSIYATYTPAGGGAATGCSRMLLGVGTC